MRRTATLPISGGARVAVPDSLNLMTPYVLYEQQDWFEDEIGFLRRVLKPGQQAIDVGANYGVYTLSMAQSVGPTGIVWAFEPASSTAEFLAQGIAANGFSHVILERSALSRECGTAQLTLHENSELNALTDTIDASTNRETVPVVTLDDCLERHGWKNIDLLKIDAEGHESNIIEGGRRFFEELSPLVLYEVRTGNDFHLELVDKLGSLGFESYRLVPGLDLLVPFDANSKPDNFLLNLFCCKKDRAASLFESGVLLTSPAIERAAAEFALDDFIEEHEQEYGWKVALATLPYAAPCLPLWMPPKDCSPPVAEALTCFAVSQDPQLESSLRFGALRSSLRTLREVCDREPRHLRLASLARVAREFGARAIAVMALRQLFEQITVGQWIDPGEPFLAPGKRFDAIRPHGDLQHWIRASALEELERLMSFSSFFTGEDSRTRLEMIVAAGYASDEMRRRLQLVQSRFPPPA